MKILVMAHPVLSAAEQAHASILADRPQVILEAVASKPPTETEPGTPS